MNDSIKTIGKLKVDLNLAFMQMETALMYAEMLHSKKIKNKVEMIMTLIEDIRDDILIEENKIIKENNNG